MLDRSGLEQRAVMLRRLGDKLRGLREAEALGGIEVDVQALTEADGLVIARGHGLAWTTACSRCCAPRPRSGG